MRKHVPRSIEGENHYRLGLETSSDTAAKILRSTLWGIVEGDMMQSYLFGSKIDKIFEMSARGPARSIKARRFCYRRCMSLGSTHIVSTPVVRTAD